jgi:formiminotetrahydrofolate cyclodeaminase
VEGAGMNVRINLSGLKDEALQKDLSGKLETLRQKSDADFQKALQLVEKKL